MKHRSVIGPRWILLLVCSFAAFWGSSAHAQAYILAAEDLISVSVLRHPEMSAESVTIPSSGRVNLPVVGEVMAVGKTIAQLDEEITRRLRARLAKPEVTVTLVKARPRQVFVTGTAVKSPGVFDLKAGWRVSEVLTMAGGLNGAPETVDLSLIRGNQKPIVLNLVAILNRGSEADNKVLKPSDRLNFTSRTIRVTLLGSIVRSGLLEMPIGSRIADALSLAGGAAPKAALSKTTVTRLDGSVMAADLNKALAGDKGNNIVLKSGDTVEVPESNARVTVTGAILKPGLFEIPDGRVMRVAELVGLAGGAGTRAALTRAVVQHADGTTVGVDLYKVLIQGDQEANIPLESGDVMVIPESRGITVLGAVNRPGTLYLEEGSQPRISDILSLAGGLSVPAQEARISIARNRLAQAAADAGATTATAGSPNIEPQNGGSISVTSVDPVSLLELRDMSQNERVLDGDLITVSAPKVQTVFITGEVKTPGSFELKEGDSLPELIVRAGGPTPMASLKKVNVVKRDGVTQTVDVLTAMRDGVRKLNYPLAEGDYVVVPKTTDLIQVVAAVRTPGFYAIPEGKSLSLTEAIAMAGGAKDRAKLKEVAVLRKTPAGVDKRIVPLNKMYQGESIDDAILQPGDVVYVPEGKSSPSILESITRTVGIFGFLF